LLKLPQEEQTRKDYKKLLLELILYLIRWSESAELYNTKSNSAMAIVNDGLNSDPVSLSKNHLVDLLYCITTQKTESSLEVFFNLDIFRFLIIRSVNSDGILQGGDTLSKRIACLHFLIRGILLVKATENYEYHFPILSATNL
jgi:hypothetical protein